MKKIILSLSAIFIISVNLFAQITGSVPQAVKYQAIIRDLNGDVVANNDNIRMKITIRKDFANGQTVYSEEHDCSSNGIGMVHFEIGRGSSPSSVFNQIAWGEASYFIQVEVDINNTGYSNMGTSELVSVPYALYAETAGNLDLANMGLRHNAVIKYDAINQRLTNSIITVKDSIVNIYGKYDLPTYIGSNGHVLTVQDSAGGVLRWRPGGGGSGGGFDPIFTGLTDGVYPRFDDPSGELKNGFIRQSITANPTIEPDSLILSPDTYLNKNLSVGGQTTLTDLTINDYGFPTSKGTTNQILQFNGTNLVWADMIPAIRYTLKRNAAGTQIILDSSGVNVSSINERWIPNDGTAADVNIRYSAGNVVIGSEPDDVPSAALHVEKGDLVLASKNLSSSTSLPYDFHPANPNTSSAGIMWWSNRQALRAGNLESGLFEEAWEAANIGNHSIGLGTGTIVKSEYGFGIGKDLTIDGDYFTDQKISFGLGEEINVAKGASFGIGFINEITEAEAFAIGSTNTVEDNFSFALGRENTVRTVFGGAIGRRNTISAECNDIYVLGFNNQVATMNKNSILLGNGNIIKDLSPGGGTNITALGHELDISAPNSLIAGSKIKISGEKNITLGYNIENIGDNSVHIGVDNIGKPTDLDIVIGSKNTFSTGDGVTEKIVIGNNNRFSQLMMGMNSISIGNGNIISSDNSISIGNEIDNNQDYSIIIGKIDESILPDFTIAPSAYPGGYLSLGLGLSQHGLNLFTMDNLGNTWFGHDGTTTYGTLYAAGANLSEDLNVAGDVYVAGDITADNFPGPSDYRLKSDINPINISRKTLLEEIQPFSFYFKSDETKHLHFGFIAQDVQKIFPHLVKEKEIGLTLNYTELIPILWKINQEQEEKIDQLENRIGELETQLQYILEKIEDLEKK